MGSEMCIRDRQSTVPVVKTQQGTTGPTGTNVVTQTSYVPVYQGKAASVGVYSSTTVTGGSRVDGSGNAIPDGSRGSTSSTSYGVGVSIPIPEGKAGH